ncbi:MAG: hypothetical protein JXA54_03295 [Candidatus Heimdallarchaeota archaeon]|nr:hypothetical protein [Candidatus Heimdallarchaeota archaeon]
MSRLKIFNYFFVTTLSLTNILLWLLKPFAKQIVSQIIGGLTIYSFTQINFFGQIIFSERSGNDRYIIDIVNANFKLTNTLSCINSHYIGHNFWTSF